MTPQAPNTNPSDPAVPGGRVSVRELEAWFEPTKLPGLPEPLQGRDAALLAQLESEVLARLRAVADVRAWDRPGRTPRLVRTIIAKLFAAWYYDRQYSEDPGASPYAERLRGNAEALLEGLCSGAIRLPGDQHGACQGHGPLFYPTDQSSALRPTAQDPSLGPAAFSTGTVW